MIILDFAFSVTIAVAVIWLIDVAHMLYKERKKK